jgi:hypothetical protein
VRIDAKNALLSQLIRRFPGVANADVLIDPTTEVRIGGGGKQPTAVVSHQYARWGEPRQETGARRGGNGRRGAVRVAAESGDRRR